MHKYLFNIENKKIVNKMSLSNIFMYAPNFNLYLEREISMKSFNENLYQVDKKYNFSK